MSKVAPLLLVDEPDPTILYLHREMAQLQHDYARERRHITILVLLARLLALLVVAELIAALYLIVVLTLSVVFLAYLI